MKNYLLKKRSDFRKFFNVQKLFERPNFAKGERLGLSDDMLAKGAKFVADHLAKNEEPRNSEEKVLQELWKVADENEKKALASVLVKMVQAD